MADGLLTFRSVDLHRGPYTSTTIHFDLVDGFDDEAEIRGTDDIVPAAAGRYEGPRQKDHRLIRLVGFVRGVTPLDYRDLIDELHAIFDPTLSPGAVVVGGGSEDYLGIPSGDSFTLNARYLNAIWGDLYRQRYRSAVVTLECIDSPPDWQPLASS